MNLYKTDQIHIKTLYNKFRGRHVLKNFAGTYFRGFEQNRENREN